MRTIWKWQLRAGVTLSLHLHEPQIRYVGQDPEGGSEPCVWIEHDPDRAGAELQVVFIGTGHPVPADMDHVGSCVCGPFVWHVYTRTIE